MVTITGINDEIYYIYFYSLILIKYEDIQSFDISVFK